ncbi:Alpha/Beta hydrolase protein [Talaromyces proteolyticus]|uniref:Alpha/Beta hydrolase protein n=1 Tax=Talaromyces proteolyticus TaxID=1131652 RepID=A0AAD4KZW0_9EURO|nr:Alpha/Beta hydrolase protein [Talaromyces proteolyticus]KAH8703186.1 Alpha/Beta hydrolase protein [Talaromyces proteolyticus]
MSAFRVNVDDGASLHVRLLDADPSIKNKPLLIALHGAPGFSDHREPENSFGFLQSQYRILVYDARGSGISDLKQPYTNERWIADVEALRSESHPMAGAEKIVLAGGSYGGFLALTYALAFPSHLLCLILRDTFAWGSRGMMNVLKQILTSTRLKVNPDRQLRLWAGYLRDKQDFEDVYTEIAPLYSPDLPDEVGETIDGKYTSLKFEGANKKQDGRRFHAATQDAAFGFNVPRYDVRAGLKDIATPTLVVVGRHDLITPLEYSIELKKAF